MQALRQPPAMSVIAVAGAIIIAILLVLLLPRATPPTVQVAEVRWHMQTGLEGGVPGASAELTRTASRISFELRATELQVGHAYTLWLVIINDPSGCTATPCPGPEFLQDPAQRGQVTYADGLVAESGAATFAGTREVGPIPEGWLPGVGLTDPLTAEVLLVVNDHGPEIADFMPAMVETYRAGCKDEGLPEIFPATAKADGEPGPNTCVLTQMAVFAGG